MKHTYLGLILAMILLISACGESQNKKNGSGEKKVEEPALSTESKSEQPNLLFVKEATKIVKENLIEVNDRMKQIQTKHREWYLADWVKKPLLDREKYEKASSVISEELTDLISEEAMHGMVERNLHQYFAAQDLWLAVLPSDLQTRIKLVEQTKNSFKLSAIRLATDTGYREAGTSTFSYIQENGVWKFDGVEFIDATEKPLNLTFDDLDTIYRDYETGKILETRLIDKVTENGSKYIIVEYNGRFEARNVKDSSKNYKIAQKYQTPNKKSLVDDGTIVGKLIERQEALSELKKVK